MKKLSYHNQLQAFAHLHCWLLAAVAAVFAAVVAADVVAAFAGTAVAVGLAAAAAVRPCC